MKSISRQLLNGRYFVVRQLKQTSSHTTYLADDRLKLDRSQCSIKQYQLSFPRENITVNANKSFKTSLFQQIERIRRFNYHENMPPLLDYFIWGNELYVVREFIQGETLEEEIAYRQLEESEVLHLLQGTLSILDGIHQAKQMHLNLKPSNIIYANIERQIFITDSYHLKKCLHNKIIRSKILAATSTHRNYYLAPEQRAGKPQISSDFYALGNIAIQALTGKYPHEIRLCNLDNYARASLVDIKTGKTIHISSQLAKVLQDLTNPNPHARYQSARDVLNSLTKSENVVVLPSSDTIIDKIEFIKPSSTPRKKSQQQKKVRTVSPQKSILLWLFGGTLLIASFLITIFFKSKSNTFQYRNFVEYRNQNYNITIKYPQEWTAKELEDPITGEIVVLTSPLTSETDSFQEKIYLSVNPLLSDRQNYQNTIIEKIKSTSDVQNVSYKQESQKLANYPTQSITYNRQQGKINLKQKEVFTIKDDTVYLITYVAETDRYQDFLATVEKIVNSFTIELSSE